MGISQEGDGTLYMKLTIFDAIKIEGTKEELLDVSIDIVNRFLKEALQRADEQEERIIKLNKDTLEFFK